MRQFGILAALVALSLNVACSNPNQFDKAGNSVLAATDAGDGVVVEPTADLSGLCPEGQKMYLVGDLDGNGQVDAEDGKFLATAFESGGFNPLLAECPAVADLNGDKLIKVSDDLSVYGLIKAFLKGESELPPSIRVICEEVCQDVQVILESGQYRSEEPKDKKPKYYFGHWHKHKKRRCFKHH